MKTSIRISLFLFSFILWGTLLKGNDITLESVRDSLLAIADEKQKMSLLKKAVESRLYTATDEALIFAAMADSITRESDSPHSKARAENLLGMANYSNGLFEKSINHYLQAIKYAESIDSLDLKFKIENNLAGTYQQTGDQILAIKYYKEVFDYRSSTKDTVWMAHSANNLAVQHMNKGDLKESEKYFKTSIPLYRSLKQSLYEGIATLNFGNLKVEQKKYTEAIQQYQSAMVIVPYSTHALIHAASNGGIGSALVKQRKYSQAELYLTKSFQQAKEINHTEQIIASLEELAIVYENQGKSKDAISTLREYIALKDSTNNAAADKRIKDSMQKYESEKKESEIELLNAKQELDGLRLSRSKLTSTLLFGALIFSLGFIFMLYKLYQKIKTKNHLISTSLKEREILLKEIHHRVKNNLQVISSLLKLQSRGLDDEAAKSALREGQNRVKSMALIHQNLYQEDNLTGVDVKEYFEKLVNNLFDSYKVSTKNIVLDMEIEDIQLDVDTVIPLGLVVNELVSNALKYAYQDQEEGRLSISLKEKNSALQLQVKDNGKGMVESSDSDAKDTFGYNMINTFVDQLDGSLNINTHQGTDVVLTISEYSKVA